MASASVFEVVVHGRGGHAALPHGGVDPLLVGCQLVQAWQTIVSRNVKPVDTAVLSVTVLHAGEATNVVPDSCTLQGTVRCFRTEVLDTVEERFRTIAEHTAAAAGARVDVEFVRRAPPVVNHVHEALFAAEVLGELFGSDRVLVQEPSMPSEDFAFMLQARPGCYVFIGNGEASHRSGGHGEGPCMLHNPSYDFNDELLPLGAAYWVRLAQRWLAAPAPSIDRGLKPLHHP